MILNFLILLIQLISFSISGTGNYQQDDVPELKIPVYEKVKDLKLAIQLAADGKPACSIVSPSIYSRDAELLQSAILKITGVKVPVISDTDIGAATPFKGNLIILGNRSTSKVSSELYDRYYSLMDLKYPGHKGYAVRSLHDPFGNGYSAILIGGSDSEGIGLGTKAFIAHIEGLQSSKGNLSAGWTMLTKPGEGIEIPGDLRNFETWEASAGYGSVGYFGWNSISKLMAMFYMTGNPFHAREAIRLSFPDAQALKEIDEIDGERIENKKDPLAGPYHYNAMMLILYWDLIEESPVFTDSERLKVTNAFARRFSHEGTPPFDKTLYKTNSIPEHVGSRHTQWTALSVYTLARYFNKYYPGNAMWKQAERAGLLSFASLHEHSYVQGEMDQLTWYCTGIAPVLTYMIMTGDRKPLDNGVLDDLLRGQEILLTGNSPEWALNSAALDFLNKAAYLTGDGRWITYLKRTGIDTGIFRLGQSFWSGDKITPAEPVDLAGKWSIRSMPEQMWLRRQSSTPFEQAFENMSFRSSPDSGGDYILLKGYNGAYRNPYHTFSILELRLNGHTLLKGFNNHVLSSADGMVEPSVAMDAALLHHDVLGDVAVAAARVPNLPYLNWKRSIMQRTEKYVLIADDLTFRHSSDRPDMVARVETNWEMPGAEWVPARNYLRINPSSRAGYELHPSEVMGTRDIGSRGSKVTSMIWSKPVTNGHMTFFHLIGRNQSSTAGNLANMRLSDNASALQMPEAALAVAGKYEEVDGELVLLSEKNLFGHCISKAGIKQLIFSADLPVDVDWDLSNGKIFLVNKEEVKLNLAVIQSNIELDGKTIKGKKDGGLYSFSIPAGRHEINGANITKAARTSLFAGLKLLINIAGETRKNELAYSNKTDPGTAPGLNVAFQANIDGSPAESIIIPSENEEILCIAAGKTISLLGREGKILRQLSASGNVRVLNWWAEHRLLLAGCDNEEVIAWDENGNKKWTFTSVMDPAVYEAGKPYWFKSAYPGIYGLYSGEFDNGKSRAFIGSACTLEIIDENGELVKRLPVFWGPGRQFLMVNAQDGSKNLLIGRHGNDFVTLVAVNSKTMTETGRGYNEVPEGHTFVNGWDAMNRYDNILTDLDGDGKREVVSAINGTWNRVSVYTENGAALYNAQFGPGINGARTNMRMMDAGDVDGNGKKEIVVAISAGFVNVLNDKAEKLWARLLPSPPTVVKIIQSQSQTWICAGCEDGTVFALDGSGKILRMSKMNGRPVDLQIMNTTKGKAGVITTDTGEMKAFVFSVQPVVK